MARSKTRTAEVRVKLSPEISDSLAAIAAARGLLPATLAAVALGEYVEKTREMAKLNAMVVLDVSKRMSASLTDERMEKLFQSVLTPECLREIALIAQSQEGIAGQAGSSAVPEAAAPGEGIGAAGALPR